MAEEQSDRRQIELESLRQGAASVHTPETFGRAMLAQILQDATEKLDGPLTEHAFEGRFLIRPSRRMPRGAEGEFCVTVCYTTDGGTMICVQVCW
jgi:hypothetical protein